MFGGGRSMTGNCVHQERTALPAVLQEPKPEIDTLARAPDRAPCASEEREVEEDDRVCGSKPDFDGVIRSEIAIDDPFIFADKFLLEFHPPMTRCPGKSCLPEDFIQFYNS